MRKLILIAALVLAGVQVKACDNPVIDVYSVMVFSDSEGFQSAMATNIANGWVPFGSLAVTYDMGVQSLQYVQPIVIYRCPEDPRREVQKPVLK